MQTLLIPGFTQTVESWDSVVSGLRGFGTEAMACTIPQCATFQATSDEMASQYGRGLWCGYSMGGRIALLIALNHPHLVQHLMLVSTTAGIESAEARAERRTADAMLAHSALDDGTETFLRRWLAQPMFANVDDTAAGLAERRSIRPESHQDR